MSTATSSQQQQGPSVQSAIVALANMLLIQKLIPLALMKSLGTAAMRILSTEKLTMLTRRSCETKQQVHDCISLPEVVGHDKCLPVCLTLSP